MPRSSIAGRSSIQRCKNVERNKTFMAPLASHRSVLVWCPTNRVSTSSSSCCHSKSSSPCRESTGCRRRGAVLVSLPPAGDWVAMPVLGGPPIASNLSFRQSNLRPRGWRYTGCMLSSRTRRHFDRSVDVVRQRALISINSRIRERARAPTHLDGNGQTSARMIGRPTGLQSNRQ